MWWSPTISVRTPTESSPDESRNVCSFTNCSMTSAEISLAPFIPNVRTGRVRSSSILTQVGSSAFRTAMALSPRYSRIRRLASR